MAIIYRILTERKPYRELGGTYFDKCEREQIERRLVWRLKRLGYNVSLEPADSSPQPTI